MKHLKVPFTDGELKFVLEYVTPERRRELLIAEAHRISGKRLEELLSGLSERNASALMVGPMFVGGDSSDMETFITDVWGQPVTDANLREVIVAFQEWYKETNPREYHAPEPPAFLRWQGGLP